MRALLVAIVLPSVALGLTAMADPPRRTIDASRAFDATAPVPDVTITRTPVDPPALVEKSQWVLDLRWDQGEVWLVGVHPLELPAAQATPRVMGRFAVELFEGPTLIERARFDFPLLGAAEPEGGISFTSKLKTRIGVVFPATKRGTRLELVDRASGRRWALPWPAGDPSPAPLDAGSTGGAGSGPLPAASPPSAARPSPT